MDKTAIRGFKDSICYISHRHKKRPILAKVVGVTDESVIVQSNRKGAILLSDITQITEAPQWKWNDIQNMWEIMNKPPVKEDDIND